jgi:hypothetical protein
MIHANRSNPSSYRKVSRCANTGSDHIDGESTTPDLCKRIWRTEHRDHGRKDQVLSGNLFYSGTSGDET